MLSGVLPTVEPKGTLDDVPSGAMLDDELVATGELKLAVGAVNVVATFEPEIPELVLAAGIDDVGEVETLMLELRLPMLEVVAGIGKEIELEDAGLELDTAMLELGVGPDGTVELEGTPLELGTLELGRIDEEIPAIEPELAMLELTEEL
jgi:hypothetical protein